MIHNKWDVSLFFCYANSSGRVKETGIVEEVKLGIIKISGLPNCFYGQLIEIGWGLKGMIIEFNQYTASGCSAMNIR